MSDQKVAGYAEVTGRVRDGRMPRRKLVIDAEGGIRGLYDDSVVGLGEIQAVTRASHVEWSDGAWAERGGMRRGWYVMLGEDAPGTLIGSGFPTRAEALAFEVAWLQDNVLK